MSATPQRLFACALALLSLSACAHVDTSGYPTLERRAVEDVVAAETAARGEDPPPPPPAIASAEARAAAAQLIEEARAGDAEFRAALTANRGAAAAGQRAATGSEAWALGEVALSRIETARGRTRLALDRLDRLAQAAAEAGLPGNVAAYAEAQAVVRQLVEGHAATVRTLSR